MSVGKKRLLWFPLVGLVLVAAALFVLGKTGVVDLPWPPGPEEVAAGENGEGDDGKNEDGEDEEEVIPVPVELATAVPRQISAFYRASSVVEADRQVDLVAKVPGRVQRVAVEEGDWVDKGDVLAELENGRERVQLRQAELKEADQRRELTRRESLLAKNLITQDDFDDQRSVLDLAKADRELAAITVEETLIRAPFDGQVTDRKVVPGQHINVSEPLFTLVDFEPLRVRIHLPEIVARKIRPNDEVHLVVEALDAPVAAVVERIAPVVDPQTSTVRLTLLVEGDAREEMRVGGFVKVRVTTDTHTEALSVPKLALVEEGGLRSVFVAEADTVRKVEIRTGLYDETHVEILDGVEEGAWVVSLGQGGLRTGARIDVLNATQVGWVAPDSTDGEEEDADGADDDAPGEDGAPTEPTEEAAGSDGGETLADAGDASGDDAADPADDRP